MASAATNGKTNETSENIFLPKNISSDNNANPNNVSNNMRSTGAIPKTKINSFVDPYVQNNVDSQTQENNCMKGSSSKNISKVSTNGFKSLTVNGIHNGSCNQFASYNPMPTKDQHIVNTLNRNSPSDELHLDTTYFNDAEAGPSTSHGSNNIQQHSDLQQRLKDSESECSSDTGNDDLSCSDECCIYTYKGDMADLPRSFLNMDMPDNNDAQDQSRAGSRGSSPEMDFLEMDFDPGPSCDADSDESSINSDIKSYDDLPEGEEYETNDENPLQPNSDDPNINNSDNAAAFYNSDLNEQSQKNNLSQQNVIIVPNNEPEMQNVVNNETKQLTNGTFLTINLIDEPWIPKIIYHRTFCSSVLRESKGLHSSSGDLISPNDNVIATTSTLDCRVNTSSSLYHSTMEKQLVLDKQPTTADEEHVLSVEKTMIWSEQEAATTQITQIGTSACGATAVLNVLLALGYPAPTNDQLIESVTTRQRANSSPLVQYLKSRSVAGSTHKDIIQGLNKITNGQVYARFFHMYPERYINLSQWLSYWIKKGAIPIATLNLQKGVKSGNAIPDAWHHQMLFGVGPHGIYLTNPLERVEEGILWHHLSSESVLLVRREDILSRWNSKTNLRELMAIKGVQWHKLNVLGQVANVVREHQRLVSPQAVSRTHVSIPAAYSAGITLAMNISNPACELLKHYPELPLLSTLP
ncbi:hypothetical protein CBL_08113 [Carabus blaptoides fortunei]